MCGGPVAWASRRQSTVAQSTTEAELVSLNEASKEAVWIKRLLEELNGSSIGPVEIRCDNQSTIRLVFNPELHQRTKHIEVKHFYVRELQQKGEINVIFTDTSNQLADSLTKSLPRSKFEELWKKFGLK